MLAVVDYPGVWLNGPASPAVRLVLELAAAYLALTFGAVGARNLLRRRLCRRLVGEGLVALPRARWRVVVEVPGAAYRSPTHEAVHLFVDESPRTLPFATLRGARLVEDPAGRGEPELVAALHVELHDGERVAVPATAIGFHDLVKVLDRRGLVTRVELAA